MVLKFDNAWRFNPPPDGMFQNSTIPDDAIEVLFGLIFKIVTNGDPQDILEHFKRHFCAAIGTMHIRSSNISWAETDLHSYMQQAAQNAPLFIEAFWDACNTLKNKNPEYYIPDAAMINNVLQKHGVGFAIEPPNLVLRENEAPLVAVPESPPTLAEKAIEVFQVSLRRSEQLLSEGHGREAVQEILWLLETVSTAFRGLDTGTGTIEGKYFNQIARELKKFRRGTSIDRIVDWMTTLHGYLSSPTGGGVRHGLDLNEGVTISLNEAKLFCNLVRSYLGFLLNEHERLTQSGKYK